MKRTRFAIVLVALALIAAACGGGDDSAGSTVTTQPTESTVAPAAESASLQIIGPWRATEADAFELVLDGFRETSGVEVVYEGVDDVLAPLSTRIAAGSPPDLAVLPTGNGLLDFAAQGALVPLDFMQDELASNFADGLLGAFSVDGTPYAFPTRADIGSALWYNPAVVTEPPATWADFVAYCDSMAASGEACVAGIGADGWTLDMLFAVIYTASYGAAQNTALWAGDVPFTDPSVSAALEKMTTYYGADYAAGGPEGALGTGLVDGFARVFGENADATFVQAGSWGGGLAIGAVNENLVEGETIDYVMFPTESAGENASMVYSDVVVVLTDSPAARELAQYLASTDGQTLFLESGYSVANVHVDSSSETGLLGKTSGLLATVDGTTELISNDLKAQWIELLGAVILDPSTISSQLEDFQSVAQDSLG
ncbi:MAG: extracellular solute-binding protein [Acidimicrobiia bacterium]